MLAHILATKQTERSHIRSDRNHFRTVFQWKNAKIIGEIKPKKPLSEKFCEASDIAEKLLANPHIAGFSILIDETFFGWDIRNIKLVRATWKPTLFKEFVYETAQIDWASYYGYDAVLLIKKIFDSPLLLGEGLGEGSDMAGLVNYCLSKNIEPLIEVDNESDLDEVLRNFSPEEISIGINCRNLDTMEIDRKKHFDFWRDELQKYHTLALSGITDFAQVNKYRWKYDGVLIGTLFTN